MADIHVNDLGTVFVLSVTDQDGNALNVAAAVTLQVWVSKPDGTVLTKNATFYTNGTDGKIQYVAQSGDLDQAGTYKLQGYVVLVTGSEEWHTDEQKFKVKANVK